MHIYFFYSIDISSFEIYCNVYTIYKGGFFSMNTKQLGKSDVMVSDQIFGCWLIGGTYFTGAEDEKSVAAIREAIESGITSLDTAYIYGKGAFRTDRGPFY